MESIVDTVRMGKKPTTISDQFRAAIENAGVTRYRIWKDTGISESQLSKFMSGDCGLSIESLDLLVAYLGLEIVIRRRKGK